MKIIFSVVRLPLKVENHCSGACFIKFRDQHLLASLDCAYLAIQGVSDLFTQNYISRVNRDIKVMFFKDFQTDKLSFKISLVNLKCIIKTHKKKLG